MGPLGVILVLISAPGWGAVVIAGLGLGAVALALRIIIINASRLQTTVVRTTATSPDDEAVLGFLASYVLPTLVALLSDTVMGKASAGLLLVFLAVVYVRGSLYHLNPTLALLGFRLYRVTLADGEVLPLLTRRRRLPQQGDISTTQLSERLFLDLNGTR